MDRHLLFSSDCHAGLPPEQYRDYVDPDLREIFDVALPIQLEETKKAARKFLVDDINAEWRLGRELAGQGKLFLLMRPYERTAGKVSATWLVDRHVLENLWHAGWRRVPEASSEADLIEAYRPPVEPSPSAGMNASDAS